jgi:DHA2 family multidrug resistance protein
MLNFQPITHDWGWKELLLPQAFRGFSQQFAVAPTVTLTLGGLTPERLKLASGLFNLMRNLGGAIGIAVCGAILNSRTNLHFSRLADHLNSANSALPAGALAGHVQSLKLLWSLAFREALTQSFADAFYGIMLCFVLATAMVPLLKKATAAVTRPVDSH